MKFTSLFLIFCGIGPALYAQLDETERLVVENDEKENKSEVEIPFSVEESEVSEGGGVKPNPLILLAGSIDGLQLLGNDFYFYVEDGYRKYVLPRYHSTQGKMEYSLKLSVLYGKYCQKDNRDRTFTESKLLDCLKQQNRSLEEELGRWHQLYGWDHYKNSLIEIVALTLYNPRRVTGLIQRKMPEGKIETESHYQVACTSWPEYISVPSRPKNFSIGSAARMRNSIASAVDQMKEIRKGLLSDLSVLEIPYGESYSPEDSIAIGNGIEWEINFNHRMADEKSGRWKGSGRTDRGLEYDPGDPEMEEMYRKRESEAVSRLEEFKSKKLLTQLIGLGMKRRILESLQLVDRHIGILEMELESLDYALHSEFNAIKTRSLGTLEEYQQMFQSRVEHADLKMDSARFFDPGEVTKFSSDQIVFMVSKILKEFESVKDEASSISEMKLKRVVQLLLDFGIQEWGRPIPKNARVPGDLNADYEQGLRSDVIDVVLERYFLLEDQDHLPTPSFVYTNEQRATLLKLYSDILSFGEMAQRYVGVVLLAHSFWHPQILWDLERLDPDILSENEIDRLSLSAFDALPYIDQLSALQDLESIHSRITARARASFEERLRLQPVNVVKLELADWGSNLEEAEAVYIREIESIESALKNNQPLVANERLAEMIENLNLPQALATIGRLKVFPEISDSNWKSLLEVIANHFETKWSRLIDAQEISAVSLNPSEASFDADAIEYDLEAAGYYLSSLSNQVLILRKTLRGRAELLRTIAEIHLRMDGGRSQALSILTKLGGQLETESQLVVLYSIYEPFFEQILEVGLDRKLAYEDLINSFRIQPEGFDINDVKKDIDQSTMALRHLQLQIIAGGVTEAESYLKFNEKIKDIQERMKIELINAERRIDK